MCLEQPPARNGEGKSAYICVFMCLYAHVQFVYTLTTFSEVSLDTLDRKNKNSTQKCKIIQDKKQNPAAEYASTAKGTHTNHYKI